MPVLAMASGPDGLMNDPAPANVWALKPEDFTTQHQLVQRKTLDRTAAAEVFTAQLGKTMCNVTNWHPYERALLAVFGLQVFLNDRAAASRLLDDLNRSCVVRRFYDASGFHLCRCSRWPMQLLNALFRCQGSTSGWLVTGMCAVRWLGCMPVTCDCPGAFSLAQGC